MAGKCDKDNHDKHYYLSVGGQVLLFAYLRSCFPNEGAIDPPPSVLTGRVSSIESLSARKQITSGHFFYPLPHPPSC